MGVGVVVGVLLGVGVTLGVKVLVGVAVMVGVGVLVGVLVIQPLWMFKVTELDWTIEAAPLPMMAAWLAKVPQVTTAERVTPPVKLKVVTGWAPPRSHSR